MNMLSSFCLAPWTLDGVNCWIRRWIQSLYSFAWSKSLCWPWSSLPSSFTFSAIWCAAPGWMWLAGQCSSRDVTRRLDLNWPAIMTSWASESMPDVFIRPERQPSAFRLKHPADCISSHLTWRRLRPWQPPPNLSRSSFQHRKKVIIAQFIFLLPLCFLHLITYRIRRFMNRQTESKQNNTHGKYFVLTWWMTAWRQLRLWLNTVMQSLKHLYHNLIKFSKSQNWVTKWCRLVEINQFLHKITILVTVATFKLV